jgi:hypothetical protein
VAAIQHAEWQLDPPCGVPVNAVGILCLFDRARWVVPIFDADIAGDKPPGWIGERAGNSSKSVNALSSRTEIPPAPGAESLGG